MLFALFWWMALSAVGGLVPHKVWMGHHKLWTDGYWLFYLWTGSGADIAELARSANWRDLLKLFQSDGPRSTMTRKPVELKLRPQIAGPVVLQEQRALLSSRLLRKARLISVPPA
jgi:hypothetical protein